MSPFPLVSGDENRVGNSSPEIEQEIQSGWSDQGMICRDQDPSIGGSRVKRSGNFGEAEFHTAPHVRRIFRGNHDSKIAAMDLFIESKIGLTTDNVDRGDLRASESLQEVADHRRLSEGEQEFGGSHPSAETRGRNDHMPMRLDWVRSVGLIRRHGDELAVVSLEWEKTHCNTGKSGHPEGVSAG